MIPLNLTEDNILSISTRDSFPTATTNIIFKILNLQEQKEDTFIPILLSSNDRDHQYLLNPELLINVNDGYSDYEIYKTTFVNTPSNTVDKYSLTKISSTYSGRIIIGIAGVNIYISTDYGMNFELVYTYTTTITAIKISRNGEIILFSDGRKTFISTDYGLTFTQTNIPATTTCYDIDMSYDGKYVLVATNLGVYKCDNYGTNFNITPAITNAKKISISYTGKYIALITADNTIIYSIDYGVNYLVSDELGGIYNDICMNDDGDIIYITDSFDSNIKKSINYGDTFTDLYIIDSNIANIETNSTGQYIYCRGLDLNISSNYGISFIKSTLDSSIFTVSYDGINYCIVTGDINYNSLGLSYNTSNNIITTNMTLIDSGKIKIANSNNNTITTYTTENTVKVYQK